jgi:hypothetical protein
MNSIKFNLLDVNVFMDHFQKLGSKLKFGFFAEKKSYRNARQKTTGQLQKLGSKC